MLLIVKDNLEELSKLEIHGVNLNGMATFQIILLCGLKKIEKN